MEVTKGMQKTCQELYGQPHSEIASRTGRVHLSHLLNWCDFIFQYMNMQRPDYKQSTHHLKPLFMLRTSKFTQVGVLKYTTQFFHSEKYTEKREFRLLYFTETFTALDKTTPSPPGCMELHKNSMNGFNDPNKKL